MIIDTGAAAMYIDTTKAAGMERAQIPHKKFEGVFGTVESPGTPLESTFW